MHNHNESSIFNASSINLSSSQSSPQSQVKHILEKLQLIDYSASLHTINANLNNLLKQHINLDKMYPESMSQVGDLLVQDGLFHQMWGHVLRKKSLKMYFAEYYQKYYEKLTVNHTNFERMFNPIESSNDGYFQLEDNTNTRLTSKKEQKPNKIQIQDVSYNLSKQNSQPTYQGPLLYLQLQESGRKKINGTIQTNGRKTLLQMVVHFMGLDAVYHFKQIEQVKIIQYYEAKDDIFVIVEGQICEKVPQGSKIMGRYRRIKLIGTQGQSSLTRMMRVKMNHKIQALLYWEENCNIKAWVKPLKNQASKK